MASNSHTRRAFIHRGLTLVSAAVTVPSFIDSTVWAMADPMDSKRLQQESGADGKILVVVQLSGGNDGLNTVVPFADDTYRRLRPAIGKKAEEVLKLNNYLGLHPNLAPMKSLYDDGMMSIIQGVGYPNPNRSHFRSMDIWHSGIPEKEMVASGWLGRYFDNTCVGQDPHAGVSIGETAPLSMRGEKISPLSFERPENYRYNGQDAEHYKQLNTAAPAASLDPKAAKILTPGSQLEFLTRTAMDAQVSSDKILDLVKNYNTTSEYPRNEFGNGLKTIAAMIRGSLPTRVYYVSLGGFDTHANQMGRHDRLMKELADGVGAFWKDMKEQKNEQRVMMMCFSEFGRRVQQNASQGTDHGAAAPMFLLGPAIAKKAGLIGNHPSLTQLDQGDLMFNIDFRNVYATVLQDWLGTPSKPILGQQFKTMPIITA
ncbi:MAG: DUF1501 domain-containing protein [Burkholderiales bacterium]|nr:DUF1501 domain-containing protein [Phycisphaerae bacterium]